MVSPPGLPDDAAATARWRGSRDATRLRRWTRWGSHTTRRTLAAAKKNCVATGWRRAPAGRRSSGPPPRPLAVLTERCGRLLLATRVGGRSAGTRADGSIDPDRAALRPCTCRPSCGCTGNARRARAPERSAREVAREQSQPSIDQRVDALLQLRGKLPRHDLFVQTPSARHHPY